MNIAVLGNIPLLISKQTPAGTEVLTALLMQGLKELGHSLTLYATIDEQPHAKTVGFFSSSQFKEETKDITGLKYQNLISSYQNLLIKKLVGDSAQFDIAHNNLYLTSMVFPFIPEFSCPVVHTVHNDLFQTQSFAKFADLTLKKTDILVYVSAFAEKSSLVKKGQHTFIHNGIDVTLFPFHEEGSEKMVWFGRMSPNKGLGEALSIQKLTSHPLQISVKLSEPRYTEYYEKEISPIIKNNPDITTVTDLTFEQKSEFLGKSKLFLFPLQWEEPFGLVLIESMATGTPVVTFARGAIPEIVKDGETGFIVNPSDSDIRGDWIIKKTGLDGIAEAIERIYSMNSEEYKSMRSKCRTHVQNNFSLQIMTDKYEELYNRIISKT